jgi:hypothetical protein
VVLREGVETGFQVNVPEGDREAFPFRRFSGLIQGAIGQNHRNTQTGQIKAVMPVAAGQIQYRTFEIPGQ